MGTARRVLPAMWLALGLLQFTVGWRVCSASEADEKKAQDLFTKAQKMLDADDYAKAIPALGQIAAKYAGTVKGTEAAELLKPGAALQFKKLQATGPEDARIDVVFVGEGYTVAFEKRGKKSEDTNGDGLTSDNDQDLFCKDVQLALKIMKGESPFKEYWNFFNFYRLNVVSRQTGCDVPERKVEMDTPFNAKFENSVMSVDWGKVSGAVEKHLKPDFIIVLAQRGEKGSSVMEKGFAVVGLRGSPPAAGTPDKSWEPDWGLQSLIHELGHAIGKCGDEYFVDSPFGPPPETEPACPNVTRETDRSKIKWKHWIEPATPIPTTGGDQTGGPVGLFEGAFAAKTGFYRPYGWCAMRGRAVGGENPFCPVCREAILLQMYGKVKLLSNPKPETYDEVIVASKTALTFEADVLIPSESEIRVEFVIEPEDPSVKVDKPALTVVQGKKHKGDTYKAAYKADTARLKPGRYTLKLKCSDSTPSVRSDPEGRTQAEHMWRIVIW
ncbi:MAG: M64 family metallopeptidase [Planctomycetota bacterium]|nr:M64 family metallopeptidase [Planctomycetota bacterium]